VLKGGYALELRFKSARSTIDIDLTLQRVVGTVEGSDAVRAIREMLQAMADVSFDDWFEYTILAIGRRMETAVLDLPERYP
jgi:hypothetical protein